MASQITQQITVLPEIPDRQDRENFPEQISTFWSGEKNLSEQLGTWTSQANTVATEVNDNADRAETAAAAAEVHATAGVWNYGMTYDFDDGTSNPQICVGADGQAYRSLTNGNTETCPHQHNRITRVGATNHFISETVTVADPSGKTYTLKVKMWRETLTGNVSLVIEEGSGDFEIMVYSSKEVTQAIAEYSATATFPAGSDTDVRVRINPDDNDGPDGDLFGVYAVFLYDHADPDTNLLTGDASWQTDLTGWSPTNCTITLVPAPVNTWAHIRALPVYSGDGVKGLFNSGSGEYWGAAPSPAFTSYAILIGSNSGTFSSGARRIRNIDSVLADPDGIVSLDNDVVTLQPGPYYFYWSVPGYDCRYHCSWLYNITAAEDAIDGSFEETGEGRNSNHAQTRSHGVGRLVLTEATELRLEQRCSENGKYGAYQSGWGGYTHLFMIICKEATQ